MRASSVYLSLMHLLSVLRFLCPPSSITTLTLVFSLYTIIYSSFFSCSLGLLLRCAFCTVSQIASLFDSTTVAPNDTVHVAFRKAFAKIKRGTYGFVLFLSFPSPSRGHPNSSLSYFSSITSEFASDNRQDKETAVKHCAALGVYVRSFWARDIFVPYIETPDGSLWCTAAIRGHVASMHLELNGEGHRKAREFLRYYSAHGSFRKETGPPLIYA